VQGSVFEGYFTAAELDRLVKKAARYMSQEEDSLRVYMLCAACREKIATHGCGRVTPPPGVVIV
jgi:CRISPR-associated protein Cas2